MAIYLRSVGLAVLCLIAQAAMSSASAAEGQWVRMKKGGYFMLDLPTGVNVESASGTCYRADGKACANGKFNTYLPYCLRTPRPTDCQYTTAYGWIHPISDGVNESEVVIGEPEKQEPASSSNQANQIKPANLTSQETWRQSRMLWNATAGQRALLQSQQQK